MRADGRQNRQRILDAAEELFAERGTAVSVADIVAAAGVTVPTLYRHFGDKEGLIAIVAERASESAMARLAHALTQPTGWDGLLFAVRDSIDMARQNRAIRDRSGVAIAPSLERMLLSVWGELVRRGQEEGTIRKDFAAEDVPFLFTASSAVAAAVEFDPVLVERYVAVQMDGIRPSSRRLPGRPPTPETLRQIFSGVRPS